MKKNKDRKRKVLPLWATLLVAFACIAALVGGTVLVLFLMGRMRPQVVAPGAIEFSTQVDGMAYMGGTRYDEALASNVQLIYAADETFSITLQTTNKDIVATQTAVELELSGANPVQEGDTTLKNSIIEIPRYVNLYRPFEVKVDLEKLKTFTQQDFLQFSAPIITAKSENTETTYIYAQIFVDLPVEDTQENQYFGLNVTNSNYDASTGVYEVYQNTTFAVEPVFTPQQSGQLFLQPNTQKQVFYNFVTDSVQYDWANFQDHRFSAVKESEENSSWIEVYTFKNSYYQKIILDRFSSLTNYDYLNDAVIDYFNSPEGENAFVKKTISIKVKPVIVDSFQASASKNFAITADKYFTITANSSNGNDTLEIVLSALVQQERVNLKAFLGNVGIKIDKAAAKPLSEGGIGLNIIGGQYMQCTPSGAINLLNASNLPQDWLNDENEYYVLANSTPADANDYYWKISTTEATTQPQKLSFNLFHRPDGTTWQKFDKTEDETAEEKSFTYTSTQSKIEPRPEWQTTDSISVTMNFGGADGQTPIPQFVELPKYLKSFSTNSGAVYTTVKYFLVDETKTYQDGIGTAKTYADIFGLTYSVPYDNFDYNLFELEDDRLHIYEALSGTVRVVAATVKTTADGAFYKDEDGHYKLIQISDVKIINVQTNLSINMLTPSFAIENANINATTTDDFQIYLPVGNSPTEISFSLQINDENIIKAVEESSSQSSAQRLLANWRDVLNVQSINQDGQPTEDVSLESLQLLAEGNGLSGTLYISSEAFNPTGTNDTSKSLGLQLWFDDGISPRTKAILGSATGADKEGAFQSVQSVSNFLVYYPQPRSLIAQYEMEDNNFLDEESEQIKTVRVEKTRTQTTITWADWDFTEFGTKEEKIAELNRLLTHKMIDQYGFVIDESNSRYKVSLEEGSGKRVLILDNNRLRDFASTHGQSEDTYLCYYALDAYDGKPVYENGLESGKRVQGNQINFQVLSEGIDHIEKSSNPLVLDDGAAEDDENFVTNQTNNAPNNSVVRVEKYMAPGKEVKLANLVKVYTSTNKEDVQKYDANLVFKLSDGFLDGLQTSQRTAILQMLKFNNQIETDINNLSGVPIQSVEALLPFGVNTTIEFTVTDSENSLFNFTLQLVCMVDTTMTYDFSEYAEKYQGWLNGHNAISGVFGGEEIDLKDYISFSTSHYGRGGNGDSVNYSLGQIAINNNGNNVVTAAEGTKIKISDVYQFTQVSFSVYYGVESENEYVLSTTIVLYVNPNIVIVSENQQEKINLFDFENNNSVTAHFNVFKATEYYDYLNNEQEEPQNINENFVLENVSQSNLLQANNFENFAFVEDAQDLTLNVGASVAQEFVLKNTQNNSLAVDAVFVVKNKNVTQPAVEKLEHNAATKLQIMLTTGNLRELAAIIFGDTAQDQKLMQVVNYQDADQLLLAAANNYTPSNDSIRFDNIVGSMIKQTNGFSTSNPNGALVSTSGNGFVALKTIAVSQEKNISIATSISAIVSQLGSQFVNYTTTFNQNGQDVVNDFSTQTFENLVSGGYERLQQQQIYQEVTVGTHTVVWNSSSAFDKATNFGFVYDGNVLGGAGQFTLSVVENAAGYVPGLATVEDNGLGQTEVVIGDLAEGVQDAFVVLKIEFSVPNKTTFVEYFRMKISANFTVEDVVYPYAEDAEYLDKTSPYFNKQTGAFELDLNESFSSSNSANKSGTRFPAAPTMTGGASMQNTKFAYRIHSAKNNGADVNFAEVLDLENSNISADGFLTDGTANYKNNSNLKIKLKDNNAKITLVIEKVFYKTVNPSTDQQLFGTKVYYTLRFNQGTTYNVSVQKENTQLYSNDGVVEAGLVAGSGATRFTISIQEVVGTGGRTPLKDYHIFLLSGSQTGALQNTNLGTIFELDGNSGTGTLTLTPVENDRLTQDSVVSFGFYTDEKVAFVLQVKIVTAYTIKTAEKVDAGKEIAISEIVSVKNGDVTQNVTLENISSGTYQGVPLASLAAVGTDNVTFAHLAEDLSFTFKATVGVYTFTFDVVAQKDFVLAQTKTFSPSKNYVAGTVETVTVEQVLSNLNISTSAGNSLLESGAFVFETSAYEDITVTSGGASFTHTIPNVGGTTKDNREMRLSYKVGGQTLFTLHFTYMFTILPNVQTQAYYPDPTGTNMLEQEYVGTQSKNVTTDENLADNAALSSQLKALLAKKQIFGNQRISDGKFAFSEAAEFAYNGQNRVVAQNANQSTQSQSAYDWKIYISYMYNVSIVAQTSGGGLQFVTTDDYLTAVFDQNTKFFFLLTNQSQNGRVEFQVFVNEVPLPLPYYVIVVPSSTITVGTNAPNYAAQAEVIYAEDLSRYEEKTLFTTGRILQYQFRSSVLAGTQYSVQFSKFGTHETATRTITAAGTDVVNLDLGKSFDGYTFEIYSGAQKVENLSSIFQIAPKLTSRFVVKYYDGSEIASQNFTFTVRKDGGSARSTSDFVLTNSDANKSTPVQVTPIVVDKKSGKEIANSTVYNINLKTSFTVQGNADNISSAGAEYHTEELQAGKNYSLLSNLGFGIYNPRAGAAYTPQSMANSGGTLLLQMYGFGSLPLAGSGDKLQQAAFTLHTNLQNQEVPLEGTNLKFKYFTGLNPRAGASLVDGLVSSGSSSDTANNTNANNYITISGKLQDGMAAEDGTAVDYIINAGGANNNGNHVMMRLTYRVDIGDKNGPIEISHNILFKVLPNSSISFRTSQSNPTQLEQADNTKILNDQSIASNVNNPFVVEAGGNRTINLFNLPQQGSAMVSNNPVVVAHMYGNNTDNAAQNFTYTYDTQNPETNYNGKSFTISVGSFTVPESSLGIDRYYIDFVNNFGYRARFYFNVLASSNPQINRLTSSTLTEGDTLKVGSQYTLLSSNVSGDRYTLFRSFDYVGWENTNEETKEEHPYYFENDIRIQIANFDSVKMDEAKITFELQKTQTLTLAGERGETMRVDAGTNFSKIVKLDWIDQTAQFKIFDESENWKAVIGDYEYEFKSGKIGESNVLNKTTLIGSKIVLGVKLTGTPSTNEEIPTFSANYYWAAGDETPKEQEGQSKILRVLYSETSNISPDIVGQLERDTVGVELSGIPANAFESSLLAADALTVFQNMSSIQSFRVTDIAFKVNGNIVKAKNKETDPDKQEQALITKQGLKIAHWSISTNGVAASEVAGFTVPNFDGLLYGTSNTLNDVVMQITIRNSTTSSVMEYPVTIMRKAAADAQLLANNGDVLDGDNPSVNTSVVGTGKEFSQIYNDTLEVELQPYESVSLVLSSGEIENLVTLTSVLVENNFGYAVTRYVGISANVNNLQSLNNFKAFYLAVASRTIRGQEASVSGATIYYDSQTPIRISSDVKASGMQTLKPYTQGEFIFHNGLNIENVDELVGRTKQISLHLLATASTGDTSQTGQTYQYVQNVTIHPVYNSVNTPDVITAQNYYKLSSDENSAGQYLVPLSSWADEKVLKLVPSVSCSGKQTSISGAGAYKFRYEINSTDAGAGSAIIDENGNIITTKDFNVDFHRIYVNIYMRVSGIDGSFSDEETDVLLNRTPLAISLGKKDFNSSAVAQSGFVSVEKTPVALGDVKLYITSGASASTGSVGENISAGAFAAQKDTPAILRNWFDDLNELSGWTNKHYHVLSDTLGGQTTLLNFNNYDQFTFGKVGQHTIVVAVTGRDNSGYKSALISATVLVQDSSAMHEKLSVVTISDESSDTSGQIALGSGFDWYEAKQNDALTTITDGNYNVSQAGAKGIVAKKFLKVSSTVGATSNATVVDATFYNCTELENRTGENAVKVSVNQMYSLSNLAPASSDPITYVWYKVDGDFDENGGIATAVTAGVVRENLTHYASGASVTCHYVLVIYNSANAVQRCIFYNVTYNIGAN